MQAFSNAISQRSISFASNDTTIRLALLDQLRRINNNNNTTGSSVAGATGRVFFDSQGNGPLQYRYVNLLDGSWRVVGSFTGDLQITSPIIWLDGTTRVPSGIPLVGLHCM